MATISTGWLNLLGIVVLLGPLAVATVAAWVMNHRDRPPPGHDS